MLLWIDLETTGLDPDGGEILEVAWFISDNWEILKPVESHVVTPGKDTFELLKQDLFAQTVHYENHLLKDLMVGDTVMLEDIEDMILKDIAVYNIEGLPVLAGASVHFDRSFIKKYMWRLDRELSHRHFDVSTLRHFFDEMGFHSLGERENNSTHRAADDITDSYKLARKYVNLMNILVEMSDRAER